MVIFLLSNVQNSGRVMMSEHTVKYLEKKQKNKVGRQVILL